MTDPTAAVLRRLAWIVAASTVIGACDSTVVGGGGGVGGGDGGGGPASSGGAGAADEPAATGAATSSASTTASSTTTASTASSSSSGTPTPTESGLVVPGDDETVRILLGNFAQVCDAPQEEAPCTAGSWWLSTVRMPLRYLTPGTYPLNTGEVSIDLHETFEDCSGEGWGGWDGEPAWLTVDAIDAAHVVLTIEGAYADVDGVWDVPLCGGVTPP